MEHPVVSMLYHQQPMQVQVFHMSHVVCYTPFQVNFESVVFKFVFNVPNYITKFGVLPAFRGA